MFDNREFFLPFLAHVEISFSLIHTLSLYIGLFINDSFFLLLSSYEQNREEFKRRVQESVESCRQVALSRDSSDPHAIEWVCKCISLCACICVCVCVLQSVPYLTLFLRPVFSVGEWHSEVMRTAKKEIFDQEVKSVAKIVSCQWNILHICLFLVQTCRRPISSWTLLGQARNFQTFQQAGHTLAGI